jgi:hypothetical protein
LVSAGVDEKTARDWLKMRKEKRAAVTETVLDLATTEAGKAGVTLAEALKISCHRGWAGFKAEWIVKDESGKAHGAWHATEASIIAKGAEFGLRPAAGEPSYAFKSRIQAAIDNGGNPPLAVNGRSITPPKVEEKPSERPADLPPLKTFVKNREQP